MDIFKNVNELIVNLVLSSEHENICNSTLNK